MAAAAVALNNTQWVPETEGENQLKTALQHVLISSPSAVIVKAPDNKTNRFILQTQGYHGRISVASRSRGNVSLVADL